MKNFWLDRKENKHLVDQWDFKFDIKETIKYQYACLWVSVVEIADMIHVKGVLQEAAKVNSQGRMYPKDVLQKSIDDYINGVEQ